MKDIKRSLKKCPFCGGYAKVQMDYRFENKSHDFPKWYIECQECKTRTTVAYLNIVVKTWNSRVKSDLEMQMEDDGR